MAAADYVAVVQQLYVSYFGRPADYYGLDSFTKQLDALKAPTDFEALNALVQADKAGTTALSKLVNSFNASAESAALYGTDTSTIGLSKFVAAIYQNVLGREADVEGLTFWVNEIAAGRLTRANAAMAITDGAMNNTSEQGVLDAQTVGNKLTVATNFTEALDTTNEINGYSGNAAAAQARDLLSAVDNETDPEAYQATVDATIAAIAGGINPPQTFNLTTGVDTFTGGAGNDQFIADNTGTNTTGLADSLNGGAGNDTLTIYGHAAGDGIPQLTKIENVVLDNSADAATANFSSAVGLQKVTVQNAVGATTTTVGDGVTVAILGNADATKAQIVNYGATATAASLELNGVTTDTGVDVEVVGAAVKTLNIKTTGSASTVGQLEVGSTVATVVVSGDQNLTITDAVEEAVTTIDASALTGNLTVKVVDHATAPDATTGGVDVADITIKGGAGKDKIDISAAAANNEVVVDAGAGDDTVVIKTGVAYSAATSTNAGDSIKGGDGNDTLSIDGNLAASDMSKVISGFETLNFTASAGGTDMSVNKLGITNIRSTGDAVDVVLTGLAANSTFTIGGDGSDLTAAIGVDTTADVLNVVLESTGTATGSAIVATNYETLNINSTKLSTDAASAANKIATVAASAATKVVITGATNLIGGTITAKAGATIDASAFTGDLTATSFGASVKSYLGGSGKDQITLLAGDLKQGNTFAGGAGNDTLAVTATSAQDLGIIGLTGFEKVTLTSNAAATDTVVADLRNVTDLTDLTIVAGDATDNFTLNRLSSDTTLTFGSTVGNVVTTINTGSTQKVAVTGNFTIGSLTLDSGTTTLTITSDDGDTTADEAGAVFTSLSGTSLTSIKLDGLDRTNLGTLSTTVTSVDASASKGGLTVTASATATTIIGSQAADTITGGGAADTITGGKGNDIINGGAGADTYVFADTGANNGSDTISFVAGNGGDKFNFKAFIASASIDQNGAAGTGINAYTIGSVADVDVTNKIALYSDADATLIDGASEIAALIQGSGDAFSLTAGGKTILITGDAGGNTDTFNVWYVDDTLDGTTGTISATDVVLVGTSGAGVDLDTLLTSNFSL